MNSNIKTRFLNRRLWKFGLVFLAVFFVFRGEITLAETMACSDSRATFKCNWVRLSVGVRGEICSNVGSSDCDAWCRNQSGWDATSDECRSTPYSPGTAEYVGKTSVTSTPSLEDRGDNIFTRPLKWVLVGVFKFFVILIGVAATIFGTIIKPENVSFIMNNEGLYQSWAMVRDFLNLGFILVLLYIAFCVIFQIGSYSDGWKKMLLMMVIMALLVNFSFPICRLIIDISNIAFYYLLNVGFPGMSGGDEIMTDFSGKSGLAEILDSGVSWQYLIAMNVFTFIVGITLFVIAVLFVVRMVAIGLLIIFSPIGFAGAAFPFSKKYASEWWSNLFKYAFFAPIMIFMMIIARNILNFASSAPFKNIAQNNLGPGSDPNIFGTMAFFTIPIVILWYGIHMAQSMSIAGSKAVTGGAEKFAKWAGKTMTGYRAIKFGAEAGVKKIDRDYIGVRGFLKGWKDRSTEVDADKVATQAARTRDLLGSVFDRGKRDAHFYRDVEEVNKIAKYKKEQELFSTTDIDMIAGIEKLRGKRDKESQLRMQAFFQTMAGNADLNEWMKQGKEPGVGPQPFDPYKAKESIVRALESTGMTSKKIAEALHDLDDINLMKGVYSMYGMAKKDENGEWGVSKNNEQKDAIIGKIKNIDYQKFMINFHPDSVITEDTSGNPTGIHDIGAGIIDYVNTMGAAHMNRHRGDTLLKIKKALDLSPDVKTNNPSYAEGIDKVLSGKKGDRQTESTAKSGSVDQFGRSIS